MYLVLMRNYTYRHGTQEICQATKVAGQIAHGQEFGPIEFRSEVLENYQQLKAITVYRKPDLKFVYTTNTEASAAHSAEVATSHNAVAANPHNTAAANQQSAKAPTTKNAGTANSKQAQAEGSEQTELQHEPEGDATELLLQIGKEEKLLEILSSSLNPRYALAILLLTSICLQCALEEPVGAGEAQLLKRIKEAEFKDQTLLHCLDQLDDKAQSELCFHLTQLLVQSNVEQGLPPGFNTFIVSDEASKTWREPWYRLCDEFSFHRNCVVDERDSGAIHSAQELIDYLANKRTLDLDVTGYPLPPTTQPHAMFITVDRSTGIPCYCHQMLINGFYPDLPTKVNYALMDANPGSVEFNYLHTLAGGALFAYYEEDNQLLTKQQIKEQAGYQIYDCDAIGVSAPEAARHLTALSCGFARSKLKKPMGTICHLATSLDFTQQALAYAQEQGLMTRLKGLAHDITIMSWTWPESFCHKFTQELAHVAFDGAEADEDGTQPATWYLHGFIDQARIGKTRTALIYGLRDIMDAHTLDQYQFLPPELRALDQKYHFYQDQTVNMEAIEQAARDLNTTVLATTHQDLSPEQLWRYFQQRFVLNQIYNGLVHCGLLRLVVDSDCMPQPRS